MEQRTAFIRSWSFMETNNQSKWVECHTLIQSWNLNIAFLFFLAGVYRCCLQFQSNFWIVIFIGAQIFKALTSTIMKVISASSHVRERTHWHATLASSHRAPHQRVYHRSYIQYSYSLASHSWPFPFVAKLDRITLCNCFAYSWAHGSSRLLMTSHNV